MEDPVSSISPKAEPVIAFAVAGPLISQGVLVVADWLGFNIDDSRAKLVARIIIMVAMALYVRLRTIAVHRKSQTPVVKK